MTTELEEQFFKVFEIEPTIIDACKITDEYECPYDEDCNYNCEYTIEKIEYPEITDRRLLEMICVLNDYEGINVQGTTIEELKEELLNQCIEYFKYPIAFEENADLCNLHNKIQQLFKEKQ